MTTMAAAFEQESSADSPGPRRDAAAQGQTPGALTQAELETEDAPSTELPDGHTGFAAFIRTVAFWTLVSRVAGLARDALCFRVFGASAVWSAFNVAFVIPNTFRRLFGEGALTAAFIPEYASLLKTDRAMAGRLASLTVGFLLAGTGILVVLGEAALWLALYLLPPQHTAHDAIVYTIVMLPYMPLICATAVLGGMLQSNGRFMAPAAAPILFNGCNIAGAWICGKLLHWDLQRAALGVAVSVTVSGIVQLAWCLWGLRGVVDWREGIQHARAARESFIRMMRRFLPVTISMGTLQLSVIADQLIAGYPATIGPTLPGGVAYPIDPGGNAVLSYASRLYQLPLGVFGIAVATAVFPALTRSFGESRKFAVTLRHGVRLSLFIGIPATVGLLLVNHNMCSVFFSSEASKQGEIDRVARVLLAFTPAVWAYALTHVFTRAFYAAGDSKLPMRVSLKTIAAAFTLNLLLIWPFKEAGLALSTTLTATAQCITLGWIAARRFSPRGGSAPSRLFDADTIRGIAMIALGAIVMGAAVYAVQLLWPLAESPTFTQRLIALVRDTTLGIAVFSAFTVLTKRPEIRWLLERGGGDGVAADFG